MRAVGVRDMIVYVVCPIEGCDFDDFGMEGPGAPVSAFVTESAAKECCKRLRAESIARCHTCASLRERIGPDEVCTLLPHDHEYYPVALTE